MSTGATTDYAGNYVYENNTLQFFNQPEGYVEPVSASSTTFVYVYQYKDHLGNIRLSYNDISTTSTPSLQLVEENNYYPFGLKHKGYNNVQVGRDHKFGFGNKEEQDELGLGWIDITARNYDSALGRWMNLDPLVEDDDSWSPYNYVRNNPILHNDPDGRFWNNVVGAVAGAITEYVGQVVASSIKDRGFSVENLYKDIDLLDIGLSTVEGGLTSGGSVIKGFAKAGIVIGSEIVRNKVNGTISEGITTNKGGEVVKNTLIGLTLGKIGDVAPAPKVKGPINAPTPKQAVKQARQEAKESGTMVNREKRITIETKAKNDQVKAKGANDAYAKTLQNSAASSASETTKKLTDEKKR